MTCRPMVRSRAETEDRDVEGEQTLEKPLALDRAWPDGAGLLRPRSSTGLSRAAWPDRIGPRDHCLLLRFAPRGRTTTPVTLALPRRRTADRSWPLTWCFSVGAPGLEPGTSCSQSRRATKLRHAPL